MRIPDEFFDICDVFEGYDIAIFGKDSYLPEVFKLTEDEYESKKELITRLEFLYKTNQWIPYAIYKDLFDLPEDKYKDLEMIRDIKIMYVEYSLRIKDINIY